MATMCTDVVLPDDETVREATADDYQAVLDIDPNGFQEWDYLPAEFTTLVQGQGVKGYVYLKQSKVVGFLSTKVVDSGQTVVVQAGRIHADSRGSGMYGRLYRTVVSGFASSPNLRHVVFCVFNHNMEVFGHRLIKFCVIMTRAMTWVALDVAHIRAQFSSGAVQPADHLHPLSHHHLRFMLSQPPSSLLHLFPQRRIFLNAIYKIMADNADIIVNSCRDRVFVAEADETASLGKGENFPVTLLSCGSHFPCHGGRRLYKIDIFGCGSVEAMSEHILWHVRRSIKVAQEKETMLRIIAEKQLDDVVAILQEKVPVHLTASPFHTAFVLEAALRQ